MGIKTSKTSSNTSHCNNGGFTVVELVISIVIATILALSLVSIAGVWASQYSIGAKRNSMNTNIQTALNRMADDVRRSGKIVNANVYPDDAAPTPDDHWSSASNQIVLSQNVRDKTTGDPLFLPSLGIDNSVIYYIRDGTIYRRVVAAPYPTNAQETQTCASPPASGGCPADTKILDKVTTLNFTYLDKNDAATTLIDNAIAVKINITTEDSQAGKPLAVDSSTVVSPRVEAASYPSTMAGPGGINAFSSVQVNGPGMMYTKGRLDISTNVHFGSPSVPISLNVGNIGCGSGASYPQPCGPDPITLFSSSYIYGENGSICAKGQTSTTFPPTSNAIYGLAPGCVPPETPLPNFDKAGFTDSSHLTQTKPGANAACSYWVDAQVLEANTQYNGDVEMFNCDGVSLLEGDIYIKGDLSLSTGVTIKVAESVGCVRPTVAVNGVIEFFSDIEILPNSCGVYPKFISFFSTNLSCSNSDTCNSISPAQLSNSRSEVSIDISTNVDTGNSAFYAYYSKLEVFSSSQVGSVLGQTMDISTNVTVNLDPDGAPW